MGLLDFEDPNTAGITQLGLGLLNAGGPSRMPISVGQGIAQAGSSALEAMQKARQQLLANKLHQMELEKGQMTIEQMKQTLNADKAFMDALKNPQIAQQKSEPYGGGYSPSVASAFGVPQGSSTPSTVTQPSYGDIAIQAAMASGSRKAFDEAMKIKMEEKKLAPKFGNQPHVVMGPTGPMLVQTADDGTVRPIQGGYGPAEKLHFADTGSGVQGLNAFTAAPTGAVVPKTMTPGEAANLPLHAITANAAARNATTNAGQLEFAKNPEQQGAVAGAKTLAQKRAELKVEPEVSAYGAQKALTSAGYDPVTGKDNISKWLDDATGGRIGSTIDALVGSTGFSMAGAQANAKLEAGANKIVMDMMGGKLGAGISNADVVFVKSQLGDLGNPNLPVETRRAAWNAAKERLAQIRKAAPSGGVSGDWAVVK